MSFAKSLTLIALSLAPLTSQAVAVRGDTAEEVAVRKVTAQVVANDLHFETKAVDHLCGSPYLEAGTDVKVQIEADGRYITIRHYGVTYPGVFTREKTVQCSL